MSEPNRDALNARLRELATEGIYSHDEWVSAAMFLGDKAEVLWPAVEQIARAYRPMAAAALALEMGRPISAGPTE